ncbi:hypothetical protein [Flavobacterium sp.]|uniref:hypothetical protein n=1 Tax=Flavobacterium sp. TaxID=239 RepID=UPI0039E45FB2
MKALSLFFLTLFLAKGCGGDTSQDLATAVVEYEANTRGFYQKITIKDQMVTNTRNRKSEDAPQAEKIADAKWKELISEFQKVDLKKLQDLKAPTEKRYYDGAAIANLRVTYQNKTYETTGFDHGQPPAEIAPLVNKILSLAKKDE